MTVSALLTRHAAMAGASDTAAIASLLVPLCGGSPDVVTLLSRRLNRNGWTAKAVAGLHGCLVAAGVRAERRRSARCTATRTALVSSLLNSLDAGKQAAVAVMLEIQSFIPESLAIHLLTCLHASAAKPAAGAGDTQVRVCDLAIRILCASIQKPQIDRLAYGSPSE